VFVDTRRFTCSSLHPKLIRTRGLARYPRRCYKHEMPDPKSVLLQVSPVETEVYRAIRRDITSMRLEPGERLYVAGLAGRYDVSATPIRVALRRLERDGLVNARPRRGSVVAPLALEEFERIQAHRMGLESFLAVRGAVRCTSRDIKSMETWLGRVDDAAACHDWEGHIRAQWSLRDVCYNLAEAPHVSKDLAEQRSRVMRYMRFLSYDGATAAGARKCELQLIEACRLQDGESAAASSSATQYWALERVSQLIAAFETDAQTTAVSNISDAEQIGPTNVARKATLA